MKILRTNKTDTRDLSGLVTRIVWSGDYQSCARTLEFDFACIQTDPYLPKVAVDLGDHILFYLDNLLFDGFVFSIQKGTGDRTKTVKCYDRGIWVNRNEGYYKFTNTTPEAAAARVCDDFDIQTGAVAATGYRFSRNFLGTSLYKIIATGYTLASGQTGDKYQIGFEGAKLCVRVKQTDESTLIIQGGYNLMEASVTESIEQLVNRVRIVDKNCKLISTQEDAGSIGLYGLFQTVIRQSDTSAEQAKKTLADNGPTQKITLTNLGDVRSVTGRLVAVHERSTGLWGLFWIDSDTHTWKDGVYTNKLVVNFKNIMDEQEAGSLESASSGASSGAWSAVPAAKADTATAWAYYRE